MTTATRLSLFFVTALAFVLLGFSCTIYALAHWRLHAQLDSELQAALHVLVASIEVHPDDVEWEPLERDVRLGRNANIAEVRWTIRDEKGLLVDHSGNLTGAEAAGFPQDAAAWRIDRRQLSAGVFEPRVVTDLEIPNAIPGATELGTDRTAVRQAFYIVVAAAEAPVHEALSQLSIALVVASTAVWLVCAALSRWLCRQALRPIARMASEARAIQHSSDGRAMLAIPPTGDELTDLAGAFNSLLTDLRQQVEQQRRFAGDASHQLRTPLTAMLTAVEVTARHERSANEYQRALEVVARRGRELELIINTLLMLARSENPADAMPSETVQLQVWLEEQISRWANHRRAADVHLVVTDSPISLTTRPGLLAQVFENLLDNACKYSEPGTSISITGAVASTRSESDVKQEATIAITNRGFGISPSDLSQVFQPFFRSEQARWSGVAGVGLGLTIAQRLIHCLGGRIEVASTLGGETRFSIILACANGTSSTTERSSNAYAIGLPTTV